jgi:hypothetical protein
MISSRAAGAVGAASFQQAQQFHLTVNFDSAGHKALTLWEFPDMFLCQDD